MRATVDLDTPAISEIIQAWDLLTQHGDGIVWGRVSSSGKGYIVGISKRSTRYAEWFSDNENQ